MKPARMRLARYCCGVEASGVAHGWKSTSKSSTTSQPPGRRAATMLARATSRPGRWVRRRRACTRSNWPGGGASVTTSCSSTPNAVSVPSQRTSMSEAMTQSAPTLDASHDGTDGPPAPTSQHRQPVRHADGVEMTERDGIEHVRERIEASRRLLILVVQQVVARHGPKWTTNRARCRGEALRFYWRSPRAPLTRQDGRDGPRRDDGTRVVGCCPAAGS